jgi:hypothetical protein
MVLIRSRIESGPGPDPLFFITRTNPPQVTARGFDPGNPAGPHLEGPGLNRMRVHNPS